MTTTVSAIPAEKLELGNSAVRAPQRSRLTRLLRDDTGAATAEYAIATMATVDRKGRISAAVSVQAEAATGSGRCAFRS